MLMLMLICGFLLMRLICNRPTGGRKNWKEIQIDDLDRQGQSPRSLAGGMWLATSSATAARRIKDKQREVNEHYRPEFQQHTVLADMFVGAGAGLFLGEGRDPALNRVGRSSRANSCMARCACRCPFRGAPRGAVFEHGGGHHVTLRRCPRWPCGSKPRQRPGFVRRGRFGNS